MASSQPDTELTAVSGIRSAYRAQPASSSDPGPRNSSSISLRTGSSPKRQSRGSPKRQNRGSPGAFSFGASRGPGRTGGNGTKNASSRSGRPNGRAALNRPLSQASLVSVVTGGNSERGCAGKRGGAPQSGPDGCLFGAEEVNVVLSLAEALGWPGGRRGSQGPAGRRMGGSCAGQDRHTAALGWIREPAPVGRPARCRGGTPANCARCRARRVWKDDGAG